ncbi:MAG: hypothetical protein ACJZ2G_00095 [Thalassobaculaceae bacterium]
MTNKILNPEEKIRIKNKLILSLKRQIDEKDKEIEYLKTQITNQAKSKVGKPEKNNLARKINLKSDFKKTAYFVKEPEVSMQNPESFDLNTEIDRDETPEIIMMRLRYKIDRGEYKHAETVYAQKVCNVITDRAAQVPDSIKKQWHDERLKQLQTKTKLAFDKKFNIQEILRSPQYEEIHQYLRNDLQLRASIEPLLALPNDLIKEIQSKRQGSSEENIVDLNLVKTQKILRQTEEETNDLDDLLPDVLNHFNPMAEAELELLDEKITRARKEKKSVKNLDAQSKESDRGHSRSNPRKD